MNVLNKEAARIVFNRIVPTRELRPDGYPSGNSNRSAGSDPYESFFTDTSI